MEVVAKFLFLIFLGGIIALLGDRIGKYVGKRKLTIFNLRPRYTSQIFTVVFGMLISLMTFLILLAVSKQARLTLTQVGQLETRRKNLENQIAQLNQLTTLNEVIFRINQPIVMGSVQGGRSPEAIQAELGKLLARANRIAVERSNQAEKLRGVPAVKSSENLIGYEKSNLARAAQSISKNPKNFVVILYASRNTYLHEQVFVQFDLRENKKIYNAGQRILSVKINGKEPSNQILIDLFNVLSQLQQAALNAGMIPDPVTNNFGGNLLVATLFTKRDQIKMMNGVARVDVIANKNLTTMGPLDVHFEVHPANV